MVQAPKQFKSRKGKGADTSVLLSLGLATPEAMMQAKAIWDVFAMALNQARDIRSDVPTDFGYRGGTYDLATKALNWLLSSDAYMWLDQVGAGPVLPLALRKIRFKRLASAISQAAKRSGDRGAAFLSSEDYLTLRVLIQDAEAHFRGETPAPVVTVAG